MAAPRKLPAGSANHRLTEREGNIYLSRVYQAGATRDRVRYASSAILRDRVANEGAFRVCFEMEDEDLVIRTILRRGLRNRGLRKALERSHLIDLTQWLMRYPDIAEQYFATDPLDPR